MKEAFNREHISSNGGVDTHNDLGGLNDGDYKHLTAAEKAVFDDRTKEKITSHSATESVTAATMYGNIHKITGAYTLTLPAAVVGMGGIFRASTAAVFSIKAGASCHFEMIDGTVLDNGDKQTSGGTKNAWLHIHCEVVNVWITSGQHGTMEDTGA